MIKMGKRATAEDCARAILRYLFREEEKAKKENNKAQGKT